MSGDNMVSFNHYAFGSVGEFYYRHILGIRPMEPGFAKVALRPIMDTRLGAVRGSYRSRHGVISVQWQVDEASGKLDVSTPVEAELILPDGTVQNLTPGSYSFRWEAAQTDG